MVSVAVAGVIGMLATGVAWPLDGAALENAEQPPIASFVPADGQPVGSCQLAPFDASASTAGEPGRTLTSYDWAFPDGTHDSGVTVDHRFPWPGTGNVTLTVTNDASPPLSDSETHRVVVQHRQSPVAHMANEAVNFVPIGGELDLDGTGSTDPDIPCGDAIVAYRWFPAANQSYVFASTAAPHLSWETIVSIFSFSHVPVEEGRFASIVLMVWDTTGRSHQTAAVIYLGGAAEAPTVTEHPTDQTASVGEPVSFQSAATGSPSPLVQWEISHDDGSTWNVVSSSSANFPTLTFVTNATDQHALLRARWINAIGQTTSSPATLTVTAPRLNVHPSDVTVNAGSQVTFTASASGVSSAQWQKSHDGGTTWIDIPGPTFTADASNDGNQYRAVFTNAIGSTASHPATLTVDPNRVPKPHATYERVDCSNDGTLDASRSYDPDGSIEAYEWDLHYSAASGFDVDATGVSLNQSFTPGLVALRVVDDTGAARTTTLTVNGELFKPIANAGAPYFVTPSGGIVPPVTLDGSRSHPGADSACDEIVAYEWDTDNDALFGSEDHNGAAGTSVDGIPLSASDATGAVVPSLWRSTWQADRTYRIDLRVRALSGLVSDAVETTVTVTSTIPRPVFLEHPDFDVAEGGTVEMTPATRYATTNEWDLDGNGSYELTSPSAVFDATGIDGPAERHVGIRACGPTGQCQTAQANVFIGNAAPAVNAGSDATIRRGETHDFAGSFIDPAAADTHLLAWSFGDGAKALGTLATENTYSATGTYTVRLQVVDDDGAVGVDELRITVLPALPVVTLHPTDQTRLSGQPVTFEAAATGDPTPTVQWEVSTDGATWVGLPGATTTELTFVTQPSDDGTRYRAVFTSAAEAVPSNVARLSVNTATVAVTPGPDQLPSTPDTRPGTRPTVKTHPHDVVAVVGEHASFNAVSGGTLRASVQWQVLSTRPGAGWRDLDGATSRKLTVTTVAPGNNGNQYRAVFTNERGTVVSAQARLGVTYRFGGFLRPAREAWRGGETIRAAFRLLDVDGAHLRDRAAKKTAVQVQLLAADLRAIATATCTYHPKTDRFRCELDLPTSLVPGTTYLLVAEDRLGRGTFVATPLLDDTAAPLRINIR